MTARNAAAAFLKSSLKEYRFAEFDPDRHAILLDWIFQQFIAGEMTGLKEGSALQKAPGLAEADFLARQIRDEIKHVRLYRKLLTRLRQEHNYLPPQIPGFLKALVQPISGRLWVEHCFLDKNLGEDWVLKVMLLLMNGLPEYTPVLRSIAMDEMTHIQFGREQTAAAVASSRFYRFYLRGLYSRFRLSLRFFLFIVCSYLKRHFPEMEEPARRFFSRAESDLDSEFLKLIPGNIPAGISALAAAAAAQLIFLVRFLFSGWRRRPQF